MGIIAKTLAAAATAINTGATEPKLPSVDTITTTSPKIILAQATLGEGVTSSENTRALRDIELDAEAIARDAATKRGFLELKESLQEIEPIFERFNDTYRFDDRSVGAIWSEFDKTLTEEERSTIRRTQNALQLTTGYYNEYDGSIGPNFAAALVNTATTYSGTLSELNLEPLELSHAARDFIEKVNYDQYVNLLRSNEYSLTDSNTANTETAERLQAELLVAVEKAAEHCINGELSGENRLEFIKNLAEAILTNEEDGELTVDQVIGTTCGLTFSELSEEDIAGITERLLAMPDLKESVDEMRDLLRMQELMEELDNLLEKNTPERLPARPAPVVPIIEA